MTRQAAKLAVFLVSLLLRFSIEAGGGSLRDKRRLERGDEGKMSKVLDLLQEGFFREMVAGLWAFIFGLVFGAMGTIFVQRRPTRLLLGLKDPSKAMIVIGAPMGIVPISTTLDPTKGMPIFGYGPLMAYSYLSRLLGRAFPRADPIPLTISRAFPDSAYGLQLFLIGFPLGNQVTAQVMKDLAVPLKFEGHDLVDVATGKVRYRATVDGEEVVEDFGCLIHAPNPYSRDTSVMILGGCETYGVKAAAEFLAIENLPVLRGLAWFPSGRVLAAIDRVIPKRLKSEYYQVVVSTRVRKGHFTSEPTLVEYHRLSQQHGAAIPSH